MSSIVQRIAAPPRASFDYLAEPRNRAEWQASLRSVDVLTDGPTRVGTRWLDRTAMGVTPSLEITAMAPPSATTTAVAPGIWSEVGHWHGITASLTLTFLPVDADRGRGESGAVDVGGRIDIVGTGAWQFPAMILRVLAPPAIRADLRRAARLIERDARGMP